MTELFGLDVFITGDPASFRECFFPVHRYDEALLLPFRSREVVCRNAVSPPELAADAPVVDVLEPLAVAAHEFLGIELDFAVQHGLECDLGQMRHTDIPLLAQTRLHGRIGVTLRIAHLVEVVFHFLHQAGGFQVLRNQLAHHVAVEADVERRLVADGAVGVEDVDGIEVMGFAQVIVVHIVGRGHLQAARTEFDIHVAVFNHGNDTVHQRDDDLVAAQPLVFRVLRIDAHGGIAHNRFRARSGHHGIITALVVLMQDFTLLARGPDTFLVGHVIAQVEEFAVLFLVHHFDVGKGRLGLRIPVHHTQATIDEPLVVEVAKNAKHALGADLIHRECGAVPVAAGAEAAELLEDDAAVLTGPVPRVFEELLASKVLLADAFLGKTAYHFGFRGDGSMVGSRHPEGILAKHARTTDKHVLQGVVHHMAHMQHARHVRRRNHNGIRFAAVRLGMEALVLHPPGVPFVFSL